MPDQPGVPFEWIVGHARMGVAVGSPLLDASGEPIDFKIEYVNLRAEQLIGLPIGEVVGRAASEIGVLHGEGLHALLFQAYGDDTLCSRRVQVGRGASVGWYDVLAGRVDDLVVLAFDDITVQVETQERARLAQERMRTAFRRVPGAVYSFDRELRITYLDGDAERMFGLAAADAVGADLGAVYPDLTEEHRALLLRAMEQQEPVEFDICVRLRAEAWYRVRAFPDVDGVTAFVTELDPILRLEERAAQLERLEALATLTGGIAHDFNNLIMVIGGHAALLGATLRDDHEATEDVVAIVDAAQRAGELTAQLLSFSRQQVVQPVSVDLGVAVTGRIRDWRAQTSAAIEIDVVVPDEPVWVLVDPAELARVLDHLVENACAAMAEGGRIRIEVERLEPEAGPQVRGARGVVTITDDGVGMDGETLARATEPFFTTRSRAGSSGLGLSVAHGAATQAGGRLELYSEPGVGTTVRLYLPETAGPPDGAGDARPAGSDAVTRVRPHRADAGSEPVRARLGERVLVVDDSASVRALVSRVLSDLGYEVVTAADGVQALDRLQADAGRFDALVADVVMPGMSGFELARAVEREGWGIPILFVSGFADADASAERASGDGEVLSKPFSPHELAVRVRLLVDDRGGGGPRHS